MGSGQRLRRLELTVMASNEGAIRLYRKAGFVAEGTQGEALMVGGQAVDERLMAKLLPIGGAAKPGAQASGRKDRS